MTVRTPPLVSLLVLAVLVGALSAAAPTAPAAAPADSAGGSPLWISMAPIGDDRQLMVVVDPVARSAAVYHVDAGSGALTLKSTRDIRWDLLVGEFNAQEPSPTALRRMVESPVQPKR